MNVVGGERRSTEGKMRKGCGILFVDALVWLLRGSGENGGVVLGPPSPCCADYYYYYYYNRYNKVDEL